MTDNEKWGIIKDMTSDINTFSKQENRKRYNITIAFKDNSSKDYTHIELPNLNEHYFTFRLASGARAVIFTSAMNGYYISEVE